jgi:hypothetical protein
VSLYSGAPACTRCGGALGSDGETCLCGGTSQYHRGSQAGISQEQARGPIPREEPRSYDWYDAYIALWNRYAPPE